MLIEGSSALVVGGTGGLGEATVRRLHSPGARVVVADVADEKGTALQDELSGVRYVRTEGRMRSPSRRAVDEAAQASEFRICVDCHDGPARGGRLVGKDGTPLSLDDFRTTAEFYLTAVQHAATLQRRDDPYRTPG
ncbi:SDR family NAD(P)-dependent oxidoreductase [Streptomyces sp. NBC_01358]|uniref:SDR family NAD(P)-dependent oxidoreductase n=1 Tax=Streptomyces sp. NBC_01358 TaxID=2903837 RepID=UPI002E34F17B|nr:SDR family NAD(P)-dependent oxidoreductase [Streptomyces sp. NBC_01358]